MALHDRKLKWTKALAGVEIDETAAHALELSGPDYVTGRAFEPLVSVGDAKDWSQDELLEGMPLTEDEIRDRRSRIAWPLYAKYAERFEKRLGGPSAIHEVGAALVPSFRPMAQFVGFFASPETIYKVINRWGGPSMFPCVSQESHEREDGKLEVSLQIPSELPGCPTFLRITGEMFRQAPCLVGGEPTAVDEQIDTHEATYLIHLPPSTTLWARVVRAFRAFFSGSAVLDELANQHDRLLESHNQLQRTYRELERSEANFRTLIEQTPDGVLVLRDHAVVYANAAMRSFLDVPDDGRLVDQPISKYLVDKKTMRNLAPSQLGDEASDGVELEFVAGNGEIVVGEVKTIAVQWNGRESTLLVAADVTERNRVMDRAMQLDRMIAVGTLAAGVAHEINNPLAFVHANLEYAVEALDETEQKVDDRAARRLRLIVEALRESIDGTDRVRNIVRDLKSFAREPEESRVPVELRDVVKSAINMGWHELRTKAKVRTEYADVPRVLGNSGRLAQVVLNLVVNAAQAMPDRHREHNFITIRTIREPERGVIEVEDNGKGIPHDVLRRIFDPFFTTKKMGEGTGLGLWISNNIVTKFGGTMTVETEVGRGTLFRIELPYAAEVDAEGPAELDVITPDELPKLPEEDVEEPEAEEPISAMTYRRSTERRVMVVDDEPMILRLVERVLPDEVVAFSDPHEAIRHLRDDDDFDVVVCDATMPGLNGREFYVRLKAEYPDLAPRFLLVTGGLTTSWETGDDVPILTKPFNMEKLRSTVREVAAEADHAEQNDD